MAVLAMDAGRMQKTGRRSVARSQRVSCYLSGDLDLVQQTLESKGVEIIGFLFVQDHCIWKKTQNRHCLQAIWLSSTGKPAEKALERIRRDNKIATHTQTTHTFIASLCAGKKQLENTMEKQLHSLIVAKVICETNLVFKPLRSKFKYIKKMTKPYRGTLTNTLASP